jgi:hypothetical protein
MGQRRLRIAAGIFLELLRSRNLDFVIVPDPGNDWPADAHVVQLEAGAHYDFVVTIESDAWPAVGRDDVPEYRVIYQKPKPRAPAPKAEQDVHAAEIWAEENV